MAYEAGTGTPVIMGTNNDGFGGMGGLGGILLGSLLFGGGLNNNRFGYGNQGYGGYVPGVVEGGQSGVLSGIQTQISGIQTQLSQQPVLSELEGIESDLTSGFLNMNNLTGSIGRDVIARLGDLGANQAQANFTTLQSINSLGSNVTAAMNQSALQSLNSFNQLNSNVLQGFNEVGRDTANATNQIIAGQNAIINNMAQCCCEIKQTISNDGNATRALINDIRMSELQGELNDAKQQNSTLSQTITTQNLINQQTGTILSHLVPFVSSSGNGNGNGNNRT